MRTIGGLFRGLLIVLALGLATAAPAQEFGALARLNGDVTVTPAWRSFAVEIPLSQPVPWRTRLLADPPRAVVDFRTLEWGGFDGAGLAARSMASGVRVGATAGGWTRLVIDLLQPMGFARAGMRVDEETGAAVLSLSLEPLEPAEFAAQAQALDADGPDMPESALRLEAVPPLGQRQTRIVLDPGHGGVDPGATYDGVTEARTVLTFTRELAEALSRTGRYEVYLTRDIDQFVSLEDRITVAHTINADLFVSFHADAVENGQAYGATVYTLAAEATDAAGAALAERHDRDDMIGGGADVSGTDDIVAQVLMDMARLQTAPATDRLARALVTAVQGADLRMHRHPWQQAAFSVLKSPTVPSALVELGFLSSERDRERLRDHRWRLRMIGALVAGLDAWVTEEATSRALQRR